MDNTKNILQGEKNNLPDGSQERIKKDPLGKGLKKNGVLKLIRHPFFTPTLYTLAGTMIFVFLVVIIAFHMMYLKVDTAVISTQIETIVAPVSGYITEVFVRSGEQVKKGAPLFKIENFALERDLNLAKVNVSESKLNAEYYQELISNEKQRLKVYQQVGHNRVISRKSFFVRDKNHIQAPFKALMFKNPTI